MIIELTEQQQKAIDAPDELPPRIIDPRTNTAYVLLPATDYDSVKELLEEEQRQKVIHRVGMRNAIGRMNE